MPPSPFPLPRSPLVWTSTVRREVLANGLTVLVQEDHSAPAVAVVTHVKAGFFDEPDRWVGVSHVLEHMFFKGTPRRGIGAIARETKNAGGYLNASTTYDHTSYFTVLPASGLAEALDIQADALRHSLIDGEELARELQVIIQEAKRKLDTPSALTHETLHELMFDRHRIRRWRIGTERQLASYTRQDLWATTGRATCRSGPSSRSSARWTAAGRSRWRTRRTATGRPRRARWTPHPRSRREAGSGRERCGGT